MHTWGRWGCTYILITQVLHASSDLVCEYVQETFSDGIVLDGCRLLTGGHHCSCSVAVNRTGVLVYVTFLCVQVCGMMHIACDNESVRYKILKLNR